MQNIPQILQLPKYNTVDSTNAKTENNIGYETNKKLQIS